MSRQSAVYWDDDGLPRTREHSPEEELAQITRLDAGDTPSEGQEYWYIISVQWLRAWLRFAKQQGAMPGMIDNSVLFAGSNEIHPHVRLRRDYRLINEATWTAVYGLYHGGPEIVVPVGVDVDDGTKLKRHRTHPADKATAAVASPFTSGAKTASAVSPGVRVSPGVCRVGSAAPRRSSSVASPVPSIVVQSGASVAAKSPDTFQAGTHLKLAQGL